MKDLEMSKELLIEVLGSEYKQRLVDWFQIEDDNFLRTYYDCGSYDDKGRPTGLGLEINIYEFAFKCKEWALSKGYFIYSTHELSFIKSLSLETIETFSNGKDTEIECIIKASEYVLDELKLVFDIT